MEVSGILHLKADQGQAEEKAFEGIFFKKSPNVLVGISNVQLLGKTALVAPQEVKHIISI